MKILIADDDPAIQRMLTRRLTKAGYEIHTANNGAEAIEAVRALAPDLTLLDMHMPVMDGYTAIRKLREEGYRGKVAALTASAMVEEVPRALETGCDHFIAKPIDKDFEARLAAILGS